MATYARAIYEYDGLDPGDLTFAEGDLIEVIANEGKWWQGRAQDGRVGIFPFNRVEIINNNGGGNAPPLPRSRNGGERNQRPGGTLNNSNHKGGGRRRGDGKTRKRRVKKSSPELGSRSQLSGAGQAGPKVSNFLPPPKAAPPSMNSNAGRSGPTYNGFMPAPATAPPPSMRSAAPPPPMMGSNSGRERERKLESGFSVKSVAAYEELRGQGFTLESNGRHFQLSGASGAKDGEFVSLSFSAFVWDPQTQQLREFCSSDKLKAPPRGITQGEAGASGIKMEFVVGDRSVIDGLDQAIRYIPKGKQVRLVLAPSMAYGDEGSPPEIPANCYLVYDMTLEKINQGGTFPPPRRDQIFSVGISRPNRTNAPTNLGGNSNVPRANRGTNNGAPPGLAPWQNRT